MICLFVCIYFAFSSTGGQYLVIGSLPVAGEDGSVSQICVSVQVLSVYGLIVWN